MTKRLAIIVTLLVTACAAMTARTYTPEQIPNVHVEDSTRFVSNPDGILSGEFVLMIVGILRDIRD